MGFDSPACIQISPKETSMSLPTKEEVIEGLVQYDVQRLLADPLNVHAKDGEILPEYREYFGRQIEHERGIYRNIPYTALRTSLEIRQKHDDVRDLNVVMKLYSDIYKRVKQELTEAGIDATTGTPSNQDAGRVREGTPSSGV